MKKNSLFITSTLVVGITTAAPLVVASCSPEESKQPNDNTTNSGESNLKRPTTVKINLNYKKVKLPAKKEEAIKLINDQWIFENRNQIFHGTDFFVDENQIEDVWLNRYSSNYKFLGVSVMFKPNSVVLNNGDLNKASHQLDFFINGFNKTDDLPSFKPPLGSLPDNNQKPQPPVEKPLPPENNKPGETKPPVVNPDPELPQPPTNPAPSPSPQPPQPEPVPPTPEPGPDLGKPEVPLPPVTEPDEKPEPLPPSVLPEEYWPVHPIIRPFPQDRPHPTEKPPHIPSLDSPLLPMPLIPGPKWEINSKRVGVIFSGDSLKLASSLTNADLKNILLANRDKIFSVDTVENLDEQWWSENLEVTSSFADDFSGALDLSFKLNNANQEGRIIEGEWISLVGYKIDDPWNPSWPPTDQPPVEQKAYNLSQKVQTWWIKEDININQFNPFDIYQYLPYLFNTYFSDLWNLDGELPKDWDWNLQIDDIGVSVDKLSKDVYVEFKIKNADQNGTTLDCQLRLKGFK